MADMQAQIILSAQDLASEPIKQVRTSLEDVKGSTERASDAFDRIKDGFESGLGFAAGITGFREIKDVIEGLGDAAINFNSTLEDTTIRLDNLTGSAQGTAETIQRVKELADQSPFTFKELETANERLLRFNFSADQSADLLKVAADAAAGMGAGAAGVDTITEAFGRMNTKTELTSRGVMSLVAMGVPAFDMLAKGLGVTTEQAEDLVKHGLIPSADAIKILSDALEQKYPEMAAKTSQSLSSIRKNVQDTMDFLFAELGKPVFDVLEKSSKGWLEWLNGPDVKAGIANFASGLSNAINGIGDLFNNLKGPVSDFLNEVKSNVSSALQTIADDLTATGRNWSSWASQAGAAGKVVDDALTGTSEIVQALQFLLQGNFTAAWHDAGKAVDDFRASIDPIKQILEDNKTLVLGVAIAFGTFTVLGTIVPMVLGAASAMMAFSGGVAAWVGVMGPVQGLLGATVALLGGPVTLAIVGVALAVGALSAAWITDFGGIREKTAEVGGFIKDHLTEIESVAYSLIPVVGVLGVAWVNDWGGIQAKTKSAADAIDATLEDLGTNIKNKATRWSADIAKAWDQGNADAIPKLAALATTVQSGLQSIDATVATWQSDIHDNVIKAFSDDGIASQIATLGKTIDEAMKPITDKLLQWQADVRNAIGGAFSNLGTWANGGDSGPAATQRPSQFSDPQLTAEEALAACGPAALIAFMKANGGKVPTLREAVNVAKTAPGVGWNTEVGMTSGIVGEQRLLATGGLSSTLNTSPSVAQIQAGANSGSGEIIDTVKHFFVASGYDSTTGKFNVGSSGTDLVGGSAQMTLQEMVAKEGEVQGILTDIRSTTATTAEATSKTAATAGEAGGSWRDMARSAAQAAHIDPVLFERQMQEEGGLNADGSPKTSAAGAVGVAQFMPGTAASLHVDPTNTGASLTAAAGLMSRLIAKYGGNVSMALAAYNAGEGAVDHAGGVPDFKETQNYVADITTGTGRAAGVAGIPVAGYGPAPVSGQPSALNAPSALVKDPADLAKELAGAAQDYIDKLATLTRDTTRSLDKIQTKEDIDIGKATAEYGPEGKAVRTAETEATTKIAQLDWSRDESAPGSPANATVRKNALAEQIKDETLVHTQKVAAAELIYNRGLQDQATEHSRKIEDNNILTQQRLAHEELVHQRNLQNAETDYQIGLQREAQAHAIKLQDAAILVQQEIAHKELLHQRDLQDAQIPKTEKLEHTATEHQRQLQDAEVEYQYKRDLGKAHTQAEREQINETHKDTIENLSHQRQLDNAEIEYQKGLRKTALDEQRTLQDKEILYQNDQKAKQLADQRILDAKEFDYRIDLQKKAADHQRDLQNAEILYQQGIAAEALKQKRIDEDAERDYQRGLEDVAIAHKADLDAAALKFSNDEKAKQTALDKTLADEDYKHKKDLIADELVAKKAAIADEFLAHITAIVAEANTERTTLKETADQKARDIIDAATKALSGFNGQGDPIIEDMKSKLATMDAAFVTATADVQGNAIKQQAALDATAAHASADATQIGMAAKSTDAAYALSATDISKSLGITDTAIETFADLHQTTWDDARDRLNTAVSDFGVGSKEVSDAFGITDIAVETFADLHKTTWDDARDKLNEAAIHTGQILGKGGTIPTAAGITTTAFDEVQKAAAKTSALDQLKGAAQQLASAGLDPASKAARELQHAIDDLKDKTITVTTKFINSGQPTGQGGSIGPSGGSIAGGGYTFSGTPAGTTLSGGTSNSSPFPDHIGESGPGGRYNDPSTGQPYTHSAGGVTTGPISGVFGESGPEAIIPLGEYFVSHRTDSGGNQTIDYARLAAEIVKAMGTQPIVVKVDGQTIAQVARTNTARWNTANLAAGVGGVT